MVVSLMGSRPIILSHFNSEESFDGPLAKKHAWSAPRMPSSEHIAVAHNVDASM